MSEEKSSPVGIIVVVAVVAGVMIGCSVTVATPPAKGQTLALEKTKPVEEETKFTEGELKIDGEIEAKIRQAINKPEGELTDEDLLKVTKINFQGRHKVSSFAPISRLKNLSDFRASGTERNPITSLSFLDGLEKIHTIHLDGTSMSSVESLGKLPKLSELLLRDNKEEISDLTALGELPELGNVNLSGSKVTSIKGIGKSKSIKSLAVHVNLISEISGLAEMEQLQVLELGGNPIMDISAIGQLGNLRYLNLQHGVPAKDWSPISRLKNLSDFRASGTEGNPITSLSFLDGLEKIHTIHLGGTSMSSVESLGKLPKLSELLLRGNKEEINDLTALGELPELGNVNLSGSKVTSIKGIGKSKSIKSLAVQGNLISEISGLAEMEQLQVLALGGNPIMEISAIGQLGNLRYLNLQGGVPAKDWSPILRLKNLSDFRASGTEGNPITSLSFLDGLEKIHTIHLDGTKMDYRQVEAIQKALPNLREFKHDVKR